jgi:organic hydroperoxide reductase OsmC/OhrA
MTAIAFKGTLPTRIAALRRYRRHWRQATHPANRWVSHVNTCQYMSTLHEYRINVLWTGNRSHGTTGYRDYERAHEISAPEKATIACSSDRAFRGDASRWNPEELFVSSLSACHMLWYLHLCADAGLVVTAYSDQAEGTMTENADGSGQFVRIVLRPAVRLAPGSNMALAERLHHAAHEKCYLARSVNFDVSCQPSQRCE